MLCICACNVMCAMHAALYTVCFLYFTYLNNYMYTESYFFILI